MRTFHLLVGTALALSFAASASNTARAQSFTVRAGADVRPLIGFGKGGEFVSIGDVGWLGITGAAGLRVAKVLTLEVGLTPLIPIVGEQGFDLFVTPAAILDLYVAYVRAGVPITLLNGGPSYALEGAAGISFLGSGYLGVYVDYYNRAGFVLIGPEIGFRY